MNKTVAFEGKWANLHKFSTLCSNPPGTVVAHCDQIVSGFPQIDLPRHWVDLGLKREGLLLFWDLSTKDFWLTQ